MLGNSSIEQGKVLWYFSVNKKIIILVIPYRIIGKAPYLELSNLYVNTGCLRKNVLFEKDYDDKRTYSWTPGIVYYILNNDK